jgi:hypothetical protein
MYKPPDGHKNASLPKPSAVLVEACCFELKDALFPDMTAPMRFLARWAFSHSLKLAVPGSEADNITLLSASPPGYPA